MSGRNRHLALGAAALGLTFAGVNWAPGTSGAAAAQLFVSPTGTGGATATNTSCATAGYSTISSAVTAAAAGDTVDVCAGTYKETVNIDKAVTINGNNGGAAVLDATNQTFGITLMGPTSAGATIEYLTVENAKRSGISADGTTGLNLNHDTVTNNDLMCQPQLSQDDCGESIDLEAVTSSVIDHNTVSHGTGGILLSDGIPPGSIGASAFGATTPFSGPNHGNTISNNTVTDNIWDCGITMPSHNSNAVGRTGPNQTATGGGVFNNTVTGNTVTGNGTAGGGGSGILMAAPFPGTGSYGNLIEGNTVSGNGQGGIVIHSHAPGQDVNGNQLIGNVLGVNAVGEHQPGAGVFTTGASQGDPDSGDPATTAIEVYSAVAPVTGTVIDKNAITGDHYGVLLKNAVATVTNATNTNVAVPVYNVPAPDSGYGLVGKDGSVYHLGSSPSWGAATGVTSGAPVVGIASTPIAGGYWLATDTGGVFSYGDAAFFGSLGGKKLAQPIVGIAATPDGHGYLMVAADGGVFAFGDAHYLGSMGGKKLAQPVVGIAVTSDGMGYWLVAADGGIFSFGDAKFKGSTGGLKLNQPVVGMRSTSDDGGYWLVARDGGIFAFGDAHFAGSAGASKLVAPVVGMSATSDDAGYWLVGSDGGIFNYGDATFHGSAFGHTTAAVSGIYSS